MSNDIKLSPKHGLNPAIPCCFWCGEPKNEIALLGKIDKEDSKAPKRLITDYEPCDKCKELFSDGVRLIGAVEKPPVENMPPIAGDEETSMYPTGTYVVVSKEWISGFLDANDRSDMIDGVLERQVLVMPESFVMDLIEEAKKTGEFEEEQANEDN